MKLKIGKTQGILEKNSILLNKVKEFSLKLKDFDKNSTKFLKKLKFFPQKLKVLPSRLGFYCRKTSKNKACLIPLIQRFMTFFAPPFCSLRRREKKRVAAVAQWAVHALL